MQQIILFYKFTPIEDPEGVRKWQTLLAAERGLTGRVLISKHGINGTLGGDVEALEDYIEHMENSPAVGKTSVDNYDFEMPDLSDIIYKRSEGGWQEFPKLSVKARDEIVAFKVADEIEVDENGIKNGGVHLTPDALHVLLQEKGDDVIFYDGRNAYEAEIGRFKNTIIPNVDTTKDFKADIETGEISKYKDRPIVTYCTGGIRCEILSTMMINRGFKEVYQIDGGIVKYGEAYKDDGYWEGKLYVFDGRMVTGFSEDAKDIGRCTTCEGITSSFINCDNKSCNKLIVMCADCQDVTKRCPLCREPELAVRKR